MGESTAGNGRWKRGDQVGPHRRCSTWSSGDTGINPGPQSTQGGVLYPIVPVRGARGCQGRCVVNMVATGGGTRSLTSLALLVPNPDLDGPPVEWQCFDQVR